jgi:hypothetical protein
MLKFNCTGRILLTAATAFTCFAGSSQAQNQEKGQAFKFSLRTGIEYTDNNEADPDATAEANTSFTVSPRVDFYLNGSRTIADVYYQPTLLYRTDASTIQNDEDIYHLLGISLDHKLTPKANAILREQFVMTDDPGLGEGNSVRRDQTHYINRFSPGILYAFTPSTKLDARAFYDIKRFDESSVADENDEDRAGIVLKAFHKLDKTTSLLGSVAYRNSDFESKQQNIDRGSEIINAYVGADHSFSPSFRLGVDGGVDLIEHEDDQLDSSTEPYAKVNATISPTVSTRIRGSIVHGAREADVSPFSTQTYTEFIARADMEANEALDLGIRATLRQSEYDTNDRPPSAPGTANFAATSGDETTTVISGHADWKFPNGAKVRFTQVYEDVDSDVEITFTKNTSKVELIVDF